MGLRLGTLGKPKCKGADFDTVVCSPQTIPAIIAPNQFPQHSRKPLICKAIPAFPQSIPQMLSRNPALQMLPLQMLPLQGCAW